jgi:hypothetical protein
MAINWIVALKAVPWGDVVQAAPSIVKGARKLLSTVRAGSDAARTERARTGPAGSVEARLDELESRLAALSAEQQASAELIRNLAEQNARMVEAIGIMRARARILLALCIASSVGLLVLLVWMLTR